MRKIWRVKDEEDTGKDGKDEKGMMKIWRVKG